jgi:large subunit ribosomal protein L1
MANGKKYTDATKRYDREHLHTPEEALAIAKSLATKNFDESIEAAIRLGVDPRKADQMVRGTVALPAGTGKDIRVAVFAQGDAAAAASAAGAEFVGAEDLAAQIEGGMLDFDVTIATPRPHAAGWQAGLCSARVASCRTPRRAP